VDDQKASLYVGISHMKPEGNEIVADRLFEILEHPASANPVNTSSPVSSTHKK
jgi:hypothetical protein